MGRFVVGEVVVLPFPFSDLKGHKLRPALVLARVESGNIILCQITSKPYASKLAIRLAHADFAQGRLPVVSYIRPDKLFTADPSLIDRTIGQLKSELRDAVLTRVRELFTIK